jgi:hypothetical protein
VPRGEKREEEDVQGQLLLISGSSHGCVLPSRQTFLAARLQLLLFFLDLSVGCTRKSRVEEDRRSRFGSRSTDIDVVILRFFYVDLVYGRILVTTPVT